VIAYSPNLQKAENSSNPSWQELETLIQQIERRGLSRLTPEQLLRFGRAYRRAAAALARARTHGLTGVEVEVLNRLVARAYGQVYSAPPRQKGSFLRFIRQEFPAAVRRHWLAITLAAGLFLLGGLFGFLLTHLNADMPDILFSPGWAEELEHLAERHAGVHNWLPEPERPLASSFIMTNNLRVAFIAFATGLAFGLGPLYLMWFNGLLIGTVAAVVHRRGVGVGFWSFVAPHGVIELTAIFIAGGAGLLLGWSLVNPGPYTRGAALKLAAREAVKLIMGVVLLLIPAGLIEAFFSPVPEVPSSFKFLFAAAVGAALYTYLLFSGLTPLPSASGPDSGSPPVPIGPGARH